MIDAVLFDLDGTLWDATEQLEQVWSEVFSNPTIHPLKTLMGMTNEEIVRTTGIDQFVLDEIQTKEVSHLKLHPGKLYPHTISTLIKLPYKRFIVSNCQSGYIPAFLDALKLNRFFAGYICSGDTAESKDKNIAALCHQYNLQYPVLVGDTVNDLKAAESNKIPFIHAAYGFGSIPECEYVIQSLIDLPKVLLKIEMDQLIQRGDPPQ